MSPKEITILKLSAALPLLILFLTFCKKQETIVEESPILQSPTPVVTQPATVYKIDSTSTNAQIIQTGTSSLLYNETWKSNSFQFDIDNDGNKDVSINMYSSAAAGGFGVCWHRVKPLRSDVFVLCDSIYSLTPYGGYNYSPTFTNIDSLIVKDLNYGDTLKTAGKWRNSSVLMYRDYMLWDTINKPEHWTGMNYNQFLSWKYIGIKCGSKFAWMKIRCTSGRYYSAAYLKEMAILN